MDESRCSAPFKEKEVKRFLNPKSFGAYENYKATQELRKVYFQLVHFLLDANEGKTAMGTVVECPFCPYAAVLQDPQEKLFQCRGPGCEQLSCRICRSLCHHDMTCDGTCPNHRTLDNRTSKEPCLLRTSPS
jgi:E3 ubiquitin-protein ligase RNF216